jgi:acetyl esterase/lipase
VSTSSNTKYEIDINDVEYVRHGDSALLARIIMPKSGGPFPAIVHLHGGAWTQNDRTNDDKMLSALARFGVTVVSIDFRMPPVAGYPASLADANSAVRWAKANSERLRTTPDRVGIMGSSSGGHQAVLAGMRPEDPRYSAIPMAGGFDASVPYVVALWPVIDPLGRYHYAKDLEKAGQRPEFTANIIAAHDAYWGSEDAMSEGSPVQILERGEDVATPPVFYVGSEADQSHPYPHLDRFVTAYRARGGLVNLQLTETPAGSWLATDPESASSLALFEQLHSFLLESVSDLHR